MAVQYEITIEDKGNRNEGAGGGLIDVPPCISGVVMPVAGMIKGGHMGCHQIHLDNYSLQFEFYHGLVSPLFSQVIKRFKK